MTIHKTEHPAFACANITISAGDTQIVNGVNLEIYPRRIHAIMGPNGSGKSTFASGVMGHPDLAVSGELFLDGEPIQNLPVHERARRGLFLGFQYPVAIPGVTVLSFLRSVLSEKAGAPVDVFTFHEKLETAFDKLGIPMEFSNRYLNDGFSGGEKKRLEILQMLMLEPSFVMLDEIDSGLDVDALKVVSDGIRQVAIQGAGVLMVTHYKRLLDLIPPDRVHYFLDGNIAFDGSPDTVEELEAHGYDWVKQNKEQLRQFEATAGQQP